MFFISKRQQFKASIEPHREDVYRFLVWLCYDRNLAEDLLQETYLRAWRSMDNLKNVAASKSWLFTIARRELARYYGEQHTQDVSLDTIAEPVCPNEHQEVEDMRRAIQQLSVDFREPLILQIWFGYTTAEIAEHMQLTQAAVLTRLFRAREKLRELWLISPSDIRSNAVASHVDVVSS